MEWDQWVHIDPPDDMEYNQTINASASNATDFSNYNATIVPFMNDTNISGTFTGSYLPPVVYELNNAESWGTYLGSVVRFKSEWIMSGSSVSWWRCPALNLTGWSTFYLRIWRIDAPGWLNVTWAGAGPNEASRPFKVFETWNTGATINDTWKGHNVEAWGENWTFIYNKVEAPIHSDTTYFAQWLISGGDLTDEGGQRILMAQSDIGDDGRLWTHTYAGSEVVLEAELDISVIHQYGMGHTVSGYQVNGSTGGGGGGGGPTMHPTSGDGMTEALSPTGTEDGGIWDGDWVGVGCNLAVDPVVKTTGTNSIKATGIGGAFYYGYWLDAGVDITSWSTLNFDYYSPDSDCLSIRVYLQTAGYPGVGGGAYISDATTVLSTWNDIELDINDWVADGWTIYGVPDWTDVDMFRIYALGSSGATDIMYCDQLRFEEAGGGGGGASGPSIVFYSNITDGPDSGSDYVTFFMPLMQDVNFENAAVVRITESGSGFDWNFVVDIQQDFILNSTVWPYPGTEGNQFLINVTLQNQTNSFFIHDHNSAGRTDYDDTLSTHKNRFSLYNANDLVNGYQVYFRPYHALQVTNGSWVNEQLDPLYFYDGRFVNITDMKMLEQSHSDPVWYRVYIGLREFIFQAYTMTDKVLFNDLLPDLDVLIQAFTYYTQPLRNLAGAAGNIMFSVVTFFKDVYEWILEYGPAILAFIVKGVALILGIPVFIAAVLVVNSVKRYFVIFAADGPEVGGEYAAHLVRNSFKKLPLPDIDRTTHIEKVSVKAERRKQGKWQGHQRRARAGNVQAKARNYSRVGASGNESQADLKREWKWQRRRRMIKKGR